MDPDSIAMLLAQWRTVVGLIKNESGIVSLKSFKSYVDQIKKILKKCFLGVEEFMVSFQ